MNKIFLGIILSLLIGMCTTSFLWNQSQKENVTLTEKVVSLEAQLEEKHDAFEREKEMRHSSENILSTLTLNYDTLDNEYDNLKHSLEKRRMANAKCPTIKSSEQSTEQSSTSPTNDDVVNDIVAVGRLLNKASCTANGDCPISQ